MSHERGARDTHQGHSPHSPAGGGSDASHSLDGAHEHEHARPRGFWATLKHILTPHSHDLPPEVLSAEESTSAGIRTAWISLAGMAATAIAQLIIVG
nr:cation transporter [Actinomycetales bacterium]